MKVFSVRKNIKKNIMNSLFTHFSKWKLPSKLISFWLCILYIIFDGCPVCFERKYFDYKPSLLIIGFSNGEETEKLFNRKVNKTSNGKWFRETTLTTTLRNPDIDRATKAHREIFFWKEYIFHRQFSDNISLTCGASWLFKDYWTKET